MVVLTEVLVGGIEVVFSELEKQREICFITTSSYRKIV